MIYTGRLARGLAPPISAPMAKSCLADTAAARWNTECWESAGPRGYGTPDDRAGLPVVPLVFCRSACCCSNVRRRVRRF